MKKIIKSIVSSVILVIILIIAGSSFHYNVKDKEVLIFQFGKVVDMKEEPGIYFTIPIIQSTKSIFVGERFYDIPTTNVTTSDKKSMICNAYVTWRIVDTKTYYQKLSSVETAQGRLNTAVYSALKNVISSTSQEAVISGKDGTLGANILQTIKGLSSNGIKVTNVEIKVLDLPDDNKSSVYERMISERNAIAAKYTADGQKEKSVIEATTDATVRQIKSDAEAKAAATIAEGEQGYYQILADAYSKSPERTEFYQFWVGLNALEESLRKGGTIVIDESSPIYEILMNNTSTTVGNVANNEVADNNDTDN